MSQLNWRRHYVSFDEVIQSVKGNKLRSSGGSLESYTTEKVIVTFSEFERPRDLENLFIRANFLGGQLKIKDVGRVINDFKKQHVIVRYNGEKGISLLVSKKGSADVIKTVEEIKSVIEKYKKIADLFSHR